MKKILIIGGAIVFAFFLACKEDEQDPISTIKSENQVLLLNELYSKEIAPTNDSLLNQYKLLQSKFDLYIKDSSQENKTQLKTQWKATSIAYTKAKLFNITPIKRAFYFTNMYAFPLSENIISELETVYKNRESVDLSTFATNKKGLALLEHLIFKQDSLPLYSALFTASVHDLILNQNQMISLWETKVKQQFASGETISLNNGFGELINAFVSSIEVSKKEEFDQPFAYYSSQKYPLKANKSEFSKELYDAQFQYMDYLMNAYFYPFFCKEGQRDLVLDLKKSFENYKNSMQAIDSVHFETLQSTAPNTALDAVEASVKEILKILTLDLVANYNLLLSISDADGD